MKKSVVFLILLIAVSILAIFMPAVPGSIVTEGINSGDNVFGVNHTSVEVGQTRSHEKNQGCCG